MLGVYAVYVSKKHLAAKIRAFVDVLVEHSTDFVDAGGVTMHSFKLCIVAEPGPTLSTPASWCIVAGQ